MDKRISAALKTIGFWSNRTNDAWAMGEAHWAYHVKGGNFITLMVSNTVKPNPEDPELWELAADGVKQFCQANGIDPKRHHWRPR